MKEWWNGLAPREQRMVLFGGIALVIMAFYFGIWEPVQTQKENLEKAIAEQRAVRDWIQQAAIEVDALRGRSRTGSRAASGGRSLLAVVDQTAKQGKLGPALRRVEPEGTAAVRVWLDQASFDDTVRWLAGLQRDHGIFVSTITVDRQDAPGMVNVRLSLQGAGS